MPDITPIDTDHAALLAMDLQAGIIGRLPDGDGLVGRVADAIALARRTGVTVGYVRVGFTDADYDAIPSTHRFASTVAGNREAFHADAPATQVVDAVAPQPGDIVVRKVRVGPFTTTDLDAQLKAKGISTLILTGVSTSGVVLSTVRQAVDLDYRVIVVSDLVADRDPQVHEVLTTKVFPGQGDVVTAAELGTLLGE
jgi:nicotinamidase-related amidase